MDVYNEKSGVEVDAAFLDNRRRGTIPITVHWNLHCETTKRELQGDTELTPETTVDESGEVTCVVHIEVPGPLNAIQSNSNWRELKKLLVIANKGRDDEYSQEYEYYVKNLRGRT
jgi:hypothetical protein